MAFNRIRWVTLVCSFVWLLSPPGELLANVLAPEGIHALQEFEFLVDSTGALSWEQVAEPPTSARFQPGSGGRIPAGDGAAYWLRFELVNPDPKAREVVLEFDRWTLVQLFVAGEEEPRESGQSIPYGRRDFPFFNSILIRLSLAPKERKTCWARLSQQDLDGLSPRFVSVKYGSLDATNKHQYLLAGINLVILTILFFIFIYNLFFYLSVREKRYRFYLITVFLVALETIRTAGFYGPLLGTWEYLPAFERHALGFQNYLLCVFVLFMVRDLLETPVHFPRLDRWWCLQLIPVTLVYIISLFYLKFALVLVVGMVVWGLLFTGYLIYRSSQIKYPLIVYYGIGTLATGLSSIVHSLLHANLIYLGEIAEILSRFIGTVLSDVILSYALGRQVFNLKVANSEKQAQIIRNLQEQQQLKSEMSREIWASQENVRKLVARQLHDEVQNLLVSIRFSLMGIQAKTAQGVNEGIRGAIYLSMNLLKDSIQKVRSISYDLMPSSLSDPAGLDLSLQNLINRTPEGLKVDYHYPSPSALPLNARTLAYRIVQEVMTNTLKHAQASQLWLEVIENSGTLTIRAEDNGKGGNKEDFQKANGLASIRQYLMVLEGKIELKSEPGKGTFILVELPYT